MPYLCFDFVLITQNEYIRCVLLAVATAATIIAQWQLCVCVCVYGKNCHFSVIVLFFYFITDIGTDRGTEIYDFTKFAVIKICFVLFVLA